MLNRESRLTTLLLLLLLAIIVLTRYDLTPGDGFGMLGQAFAVAVVLVPAVLIAKKRSKD